VRLPEHCDRITLRVRPSLTDENKTERYEFCQREIIPAAFNAKTPEERAEVAQRLQLTIDVDEMMLVLNTDFTRCWLVRDGDINSEELVIQDSFKQGKPQIFLFAAITCPELLNPETCDIEGACFHSTRKGVVQIRRLIGLDKAVRSSKNRPAGADVEKEVTMNAHVYEQFITGDDGVLDHAVKYHGIRPDDGKRACATPVPVRITTDGLKKAKEAGDNSIPDALPRKTPAFTEAELVKLKALKLRMQQDNAGGHGLSGKTASPPQKRMKETMETTGIEVMCQAKNSPEFNMCDLGFWWSLKSAFLKHQHRLIPLIKARKNKQRIEDEMWKIVVECIEGMDPRALFNIACQKHVMMQSCIQVEGGQIAKEPHVGLRKLWGTSESMSTYVPVPSSPPVPVAPSAVSLTHSQSTNDNEVTQQIPLFFDMF